MVSSGLALVIVLLPGLLQGQGPAPAAPATPAPQTRYPFPSQFERHVVSYGGACDYLYTDDAPFREYYRSQSKRGRNPLKWTSNRAPACFASSLVESKGGNLICAFSAGSGEKQADTAIWIARYDQRKGWEKFEQVAKISQLPHWSPVLFRDPKRAIYLFFKVGADTATWQTYWSESEDGGRTWSDPVELVPGDRGGRGPVKNKPIILSDGAWLAAGSTDRGDRGQGAWKAFADRSDDAGKTWTRSQDFAIDPVAVPGAGVQQPALWESAVNEVHALLRTSGGFVGRSDSHDGGRTWTPVAPSSVANNNSPIDALRLEDGRVLLVYNPARKDGGPRTPLTLAVSSDNGATWADVANLEAEMGDYSFPSLIRTKTGVAVSYTWKGERVRCWQIPLKALDK